MKTTRQGLIQPGPGGAITSLCFVPDQKQVLFTRESASELFVASAVDGNRDYSLKGRSHYNCLSYSLDEACYFAGGLTSGDIDIWNRHDRQWIHSLRGHSGRITGLLPMPQKRLISATLDGELRSWRYDQGVCETEINLYDSVRDIAYSPVTGHLIACTASRFGGGSIVFFDAQKLTRTRREIQMRLPVFSVGVMRSGELWACGMLDGTCSVFKSGYEDPIKILQVDNEPIRLVRFSADGRALLLSSHSNWSLFRTDQWRPIATGAAYGSAGTVAIHPEESIFAVPHRGSSELEIQKFHREQLTTTIPPATIERVVDSTPLVVCVYNSLDRPVLLSLIAALRDRGVRSVWFDGDLDFGDRHELEVGERLRSAPIALVCFGTSGVGKWQDLEITEAIIQNRERGLRIMPILFPGVYEVPDGRPYINAWTRAQFMKSVQEPEVLDKIVDSIRNALGKGPAR